MESYINSYHAGAIKIAVAALRVTKRDFDLHFKVGYIKGSNHVWAL